MRGTTNSPTDPKASFEQAWPLIAHREELVRELCELVAECSKSSSPRRYTRRCEQLRTDILTLNEMIRVLLQLEDEPGWAGHGFARPRRFPER